MESSRACLHDSPLDKGVRDLSLCATDLKDNSWIPEIALDIKLYSRIFRCESLKELKDLEIKMKSDGQNTEVLDRRKLLLEGLEHKDLIIKYKIMKELFAFTPFIKGKCYNIKETLELLVKAKDNLIDKKLVEKICFENEDEQKIFLVKFHEIVQMCGHMLKVLEGQKFHPLIHKGNMNDLMKLISLHERSYRIKELQSIKLNPRELMVKDCLARRVLEIFFDAKIKTDKNYIEANKMVSLLKNFESHLSLVDFEKILEEMNIDLKKDDLDLEDLAKKFMTNLETVPKKYDLLNKDLIKQSLEERLFFDRIISRLEWYGTMLLDLIDEKDKKGEEESYKIDSLIISSSGARFFECYNKLKEHEEFIDLNIWEEREIYEFIKDVGKEAFLDLPMHLVIRGILDYAEYLEVRKKGEDFRKKYREEFSSSIWQQLHSLEKYWRETRYIDHEIYKNSMLTERIDWGETEDIVKNLNDILVKMELSK